MPFAITSTVAQSADLSTLRTYMFWYTCATLKPEPTYNWGRTILHDQNGTLCAYFSALWQILQLFATGSQQMANFGSLWSTIFTYLIINLCTQLVKFLCSRWSKVSRNGENFQFNSIRLIRKRDENILQKIPSIKNLELKQWSECAAYKAIGYFQVINSKFQQANKGGVIIHAILCTGNWNYKFIVLIIISL